MILKLNNRNVNYEIKGKGKTFLLVHGWGGNVKSLQPLAQLLSKNYKTITLDLPGFGKSDNPDPNWGTKEYADFLIDFICELKLRPVLYFGHSFGGALGIYLATEYPNYVDKLIVSGASYKRVTPKMSSVAKFFNRLPSSFKKPIYRIFFPESDLYKAPELESNFRKIVTQDLTSLLPTVQSPTLILWGENDRQTPVENARELAKKIKNSRLKIFSKVGHNLPLNYPEKVFVEIDKFL